MFCGDCGLRKLEPPPDSMIKYLNPHCTENCWGNIVDGKLQCNCGIIGIYEWSFVMNNNINQQQQNNNDNEANNNNNIINNVVITKTQEIVFHPIYSSGTAVLRGEKPFKSNLHHYWEMKILSKLYGTDVMIGVGTTKTNLEDSRYRFCSLLGYDEHSWGYSYSGLIQHSNIKRNYGVEFGMGSLIGVYLDMCNGTLEFYFNRRPLGVAFNGLKSLELYPMISSTAAQSAMKMTCSISVEDRLELLCFKCIVKYPSLYKQFKNIPGLSCMYEKKYFWLIPEDEFKRKLDVEVLNNSDYLAWKKRKISPPPPPILRKNNVLHAFLANIADDDDDDDIVSLALSSSSSSSSTS